jgi:hypothetical protein
MRRRLRLRRPVVLLAAAFGPDELTDPGAAEGDASRLADQDLPAAELTKQFDALPERLGAEGARARQDILDYVAGINGS